MQMQLAFNYPTDLQTKQQSMIQKELWLDVTDLAHCMDFPKSVNMSIALHDALERLSNGVNSDYDQYLYDALWLAHFQLSLDQNQAATFNFRIKQIVDVSGHLTTVSLRLRVEMQSSSVLLGLLEDF